MYDTLSILVIKLITHEKKVFLKQLYVILFKHFQQKQADMNVFNALLLFRVLFADEQMKTMEQFM